MLLALLVGALIGVLATLALTRPSTTSPPPAAADEPLLAATSSASATRVPTSTVGLCPCPPPPRPRLPAVARARRAPPAGTLTPPAAPDPTGEVARYLRGEASRFSPCAPSAGAPVRLHLELSIQPSGALESVRIANIEPVPLAVASCAEAIARGLTPPPFDGTAVEVFSLTLVL